MKKTNNSTPIIKDAKYYQEEILQLFNQKSGIYSKTELFNDWLEWNFFTLEAMKGFYIDEFKETAHRLLKKYSKEDFDDFQKINSIFEEGITTTQEDILGVIFMEMQPNKKLKQYFTPTFLCDLIVSFNERTPKKIQQEINEKGFFTVADPTCGGGALLIAYYRYAKRNGIDTDKIVFYGTDIDRRCAMMTMLQLEYLGMLGLIQWGDTLTRKIQGQYLTTKLYLNQRGEMEFIKNTISYHSMINKIFEETKKK